MLLSSGCTGDDVRQLQEKLIALGYSCGSSGADGDFGTATYNAVIQFQTAHGLSADGIVGPNTLAALNSATSSSSNLALLREGSTGEAVVRLQQTLNSLGYSCGTADGDFGPATYNAVIQFQTASGLSADGIVGPDTWGVLNSTPGGSSTSSLLKQGCTGYDVIQLQQKLIALGYSCGSSGADGDFGAATYNAVIQFQGDHSLSVDGIVGPATWAALNSSTGSASSSTLLKEGSTGDTVRVLQEKLNSLGYSCGTADGDFGPATYNAVIQFQREHDLSVDGIVGPATWAALNSANGGMNYSTLLREGSTGEDVVQLQEKLNLLGYNCGAADGDFGPATYNAVIQFQTAHGLSVDGIVGPATWAALNSLSGGSGSFITGGSGVAEFVAVAKQELAKGFKETNGNNMTPYGAWYGLNGEPWCAMFVSWCANQAGILGTIVPRYCYCPSGIAWYLNKGRFHFNNTGYTPKEGDVVFYQEGGISSHTGIVISYNSSSNSITTIEGNEGDAVTECQRFLYDSYIDGFGDNGGVSDAPVTNIFELYNKEKQYGFANLFSINLSQRTQQTLVDTPSLKIVYSAQTSYTAGSGAVKFSITNGQISGTSYSQKLTTDLIAKISGNTFAGITYQLAKLGSGDISISCNNIGLSPTPHFSGTISFHNKISVYDFYQNLDFSFVMDTDFYNAVKVEAAIGIVAVIAIAILCAPEAIVGAGIMAALGDGLADVSAAGIILGV